MKELVGQQVTLFFYLTMDDNGKGLLQPIRMIDNMDTSGIDANQSAKFLGLSAVHGHTERLGDFRVSFHHSDQKSIVHTAFLSTTVASPNLVKDALQSGLRLMEDKRTKERHIMQSGRCSVLQRRHAKATQLRRSSSYRKAASSA